MARRKVAQSDRQPMRVYLSTNDGGIKGGICSSHGVAPMRFLLYLIVCAVILWLGDTYFYHGKYRNELWRDMQYQVQKIQYDARRAIGL
jgi:hypothetical protein